MRGDKSNGQMDVLVEGHDYDGIKEFNNPAPFWWQLFFYISIVWGIGYMIYYMFLGGPSLDQELEDRLEKIRSTKASMASSGPSEAELMAALTNDQQLALGKKVYAEKCAACHAQDGGGLIGPNLNDDYWIHHRGTLTGIYEIIRAGVSDKGMPSWEALLSQEELVAVSAYVKSLKGHAAAAPKAPQGELVQ